LILFSIGYEGSSIENYMNRLIKNNIKTVIDVRKNPISMKPGFSKNQMKNILKKLSINYIHLPEFGIPTTLRNDYLTKEKKDYAALFEVYQKEILGNLNESKSQLKNLVEGQRVALTCFEKDPEFCHRKFVSEAIEDVPIHI
jgi:uncharacterized protein (DUF488 family)